jgi:hypothetical protein
VAHAEIVPVGGINIFIGYVGSSGDVDSKSNISSNHATEQVDHDLNNNSEGYADLIRPVLDEEGYFESDNDSISSGFTNPLESTWPQMAQLLQILFPYQSPLTKRPLEPAKAALTDAQKALLEKEKQTIAFEQALASQMKELESITKFNRKRRLPRASRVKARNLFQDTNKVAAPENQLVVQTGPNMETSVQGAQRNIGARAAAPPNPTPPPEIPADHYATPV